ncbi:MAG: hypothetical protein IJ064_00805 [Bacteroidaceae bacterium]|nr:hypothetical protein [Bacteroidaceae bacterium]
MKRLITILFVALLCVPGFAQKTNVYEGFDIYGLDTAKKPKKNSFAIDLGIGQQFKLGVRWQHNFGRYFAWDILAFKYTRDWSEDNWFYGSGNADNVDEIALTTGVRGFTPAFVNKKLKGFMSFALGYGGSWHNDYHDSYYSSYYRVEQSNHCAIDFTLGLQVCDRFSIGYGLDTMQGYDSYYEMTKVGHSLRLSINF